MALFLYLSTFLEPLILLILKSIFASLSIASLTFISLKFSSSSYVMCRRLHPPHDKEKGQSDFILCFDGLITFKSFPHAQFFLALIILVDTTSPLIVPFTNTAWPQCLPMPSPWLEYESIFISMISFLFNIVTYFNLFF